jgi:2-methylcitrate dehydratase PrpD
MGAAAAAAKLLKLDPIQIRHTLGIAASEASGLRANFASLTRPLHAGNTAAKAVNAVLLAKAGVTANPFILESPAGFLDAFGGDRSTDFSEITRTLGKEWDFDTPGINIKQYPSCYYTHAAVDLLLELMDSHKIDHAEIESIYCGVSPIAGEVLVNQMPENSLSAKYSIPYCLAVASRFGSLAIYHFTDDRYLKQPEILRIMESTRMIVAPELGEDNPGLGARLAITTRKHGTIVRTKNRPQGGGQNPLTWEELRHKFITCTEGMLDDRMTAYIEYEVAHLEDCETISELLTAGRQLKLP